MNSVECKRCICYRCKNFPINKDDNGCCIAHEELFCLVGVSDGAAKKICKSARMTLVCEDFEPIEPTEDKQ